MKHSESKLPATARHILIIIWLLAAFSSTAFSQANYMQQENQDKWNYGEEMRISTDRDIYISGERVYFKVFCLNRLTHSPTMISRVAYVTLHDEYNNPLMQVKVLLDRFSGSGELAIPDTLATGNYYVSSCTRFMENFSPDLFAYKGISVVNPFRSADLIELRNDNAAIDTVLFFPEGGVIIKGYNNRIGIACFDKDHKPLERKGAVTDSEGNILTTVSTGKSGYGIFSIVPPENGQMFFVAEELNKTSGKFILPDADTQGIGLNIISDQQGAITGIRLRKSNNIHPARYFIEYSPVDFSPLVTEININGNDETAIPSDALPSGMAMVTLKDGNGVIYSRRWVYNRHNSPQVKYSITTNKTTAGCREKVTAEITVTDANGKPAESELYVTVAKPFALAEREGVREPVLQIPGLVDADNSSGIRSLNDRLLFIQGLEMAASNAYKGERPRILPEPDGHLISGRIMNTESNEPLKNEDIVLSFVGTKALCRFTKTDEKGTFRFNSNEFGTREIVIQPLSPDFENYYVEIDNPFPTLYSNHSPQQFYIDTTLLGDINKSAINMQVMRLYFPFLGNDTTDLAAREKNFYGKPDNSILLSTYIELTSLKEVIKEIVPDVVTARRKGRTVINTLFRFKNITSVMNPLVIVDGVPVFDHEQVLAMDLTKIEKIDVMNNEYFVSNILLDGIIDISTYKGDLSEITFKLPVFRQEFNALQYNRGPWRPDYSTAEGKESHIPDYRNTIYWNGTVKTGPDGKALIEFYTSDEPGNYTVFTEGFTTSGENGYASAPLRVTDTK